MDNKAAGMKGKKMKSFININKYLASDDSFGNWDGKEKLAAENLNKIILALYDAAPDDIQESDLAPILQQVWEDWSPQDQELLEITTQQIRGYVRSIFPDR